MNRSVSLQAILKPEAQEMLARFSSLLNVRLGFFAPNGTEICIGGERPICTYCRLLRETQDDACRSLDQQMFAQARATNHPFSYPCHGGLTEAFVPVDLAKRRIGLVMVGQFRLDGQVAPTCDTLRQIEYNRRPVFSTQQLADMLGMLELMVQSFTDRHLITSTETDQIQLLLDRIHANPSKTITVNDAAAFTARSASSLAHLFKRLTGRSIRQYQIEVKLTEADRLLGTFPKIPIKELADQLGFDDPLYFSRIYRKHRGQPPSSMRTP